MLTPPETRRNSWNYRQFAEVLVGQLLYMASMTRGHSPLKYCFVVCPWNNFYFCYCLN